MPMDRVIIPAATAIFHSPSEIHAIRGLHNRTRDVRETTNIPRPTSNIEDQPQNRVLVCIGRIRPNDKYSAAHASGQYNFMAAINP